MRIGKAEGGGCSPECASSTACSTQKGSSTWVPRGCSDGELILCALGYLKE